MFACSRVPATPEKMIITESGMAPSRGRTTPPIMAAGRPRSRSSSAPSTVYGMGNGRREGGKKWEQKQRGRKRRENTDRVDRRWQMVWVGRGKKEADTGEGEGEEISNCEGTVIEGLG